MFQIFLITGMCFAFVLATIIQFASVHFFTKKNSGEEFPESDEEEEEGKREEDRKNGVSLHERNSVVKFTRQEVYTTGLVL